MARFESGVKFYTYGTVRVHFPEYDVCCKLCPLLETYSRNQCRLTGEFIADTRTIGFECPIQFDDEKEK